MKAFAVAVAALLAGIVSAQFQQLPLCAQNCTTNAIPSSCNLNPKCICSDAGFIEAITCCVAKACDAADQEATIKYADSICVPAGVTNLPTAATCVNSTASATSGTASSTGSMSMSMTSGASSATGATTSTYTGASSLNSAVSGAPSSALSAISSAASASASGTSEGNKYIAQGLMGLGAAAAAVAAFV